MGFLSMFKCGIAILFLATTSYAQSGGPGDLLSEIKVFRDQSCKDAQKSRNCVFIEYTVYSPLARQYVEMRSAPTPSSTEFNNLVKQVEQIVEANRRKNPGRLLNFYLKDNSWTTERLTRDTNLAKDVVPLDKSGNEMAPHLKNKKPVDATEFLKAVIDRDATEKMELAEKLKVREQEKSEMSRQQSSRPGTR